MRAPAPEDSLSRHSIMHRVASAALVAAATLVGCAPTGGERGGGVSGVTVVERDATHLTVQHPGGITRVPRDPQRIAAIGDPDALYFLGLRPVADATAWDFDLERHYLAPYRVGVGQIGGAYGSRVPNAEATMAFAPDLILLNAFTRDAVDKLDRVAPTVVMPSYRLGPRAATLAAARALDREDRALRAIAWYDRKVERVGAAVRGALGGEPVAIFWIAVKQIRVWYSPLLYEELGLAVPRPIAEGGPLGAGKRARTILELERLGELDAAAIFVVHYDDESDRNLDLGLVSRLPMWQRVPAARTGRVFTADTAHWISGGLLGRSVVMNELVAALVPAEQIDPALAALLVERPDDAALAAIAPADPATVFPPAAEGRGRGAR